MLWNECAAVVGVSALTVALCARLLCPSPRKRVESKKVRDWLMRGKTVNLLGHNIFYINEGNKEGGVLLLLHGFPTSSYDWAPVWEQLTQRYRVVALDLLGFGFSDKPNERTYTIHKQADLVEALLQSLDLADTPLHVLAHDYGDTVAQELLARQNASEGKGKWQSCCFLNGGLFPETHQALLVQRVLLTRFGWLLNWAIGKSAFGRSMAKVFGPETQPTTEQIDEFWDMINYNHGRYVFYNAITYMRDRRQHRERWVAALREAQFPLALVNGSCDPVSGAHMVARYKELGCRLDFLREMPPIGHYPQVEAPGPVAAAYLEFLDEVESQ